MISIVVVDDNIDVGEMLRGLINSHNGFTCVAVAATGMEGVEKVKRYKPDVVIMDIGLPDMSGIECVRRLGPVCANTEFIMFTVSDEDENIFEAIYSGANSYLLKTTTPAQLIEAIKEVHEGGSPMSSDIARRVLAKMKSHGKKKTDLNNIKLTKREEEVLHLLSEGFTYQEVADRLFISVKTLKSHIYNTYLKLQVDNKTEALNKYFGRP